MPHDTPILVSDTRGLNVFGNVSVVPRGVCWRGSPISDIFSRIGVAPEMVEMNNSRGSRGDSFQYRRYWEGRTFDPFAAPLVNNSRGTREMVLIALAETYLGEVSQ